MGLEPDGTLCLSMVLYDPRTETYVNNNASTAGYRCPNFMLSFLPYVCCST